MKTSRNWCFTAFKKPNLVSTTDIKYMIYQPEICPTTKKEHYQGYVELINACSMRTIKRILNDEQVHVEPRRGTQKQAIEYCKKEESRNGETFEYGTPKKQGKRSDLDEIMIDIEEGHTMKEILTNHGGNALRIIHCIEKAMKVKHELFALDDYIKLQKKKNKDPLDEKIEDDLYKMLYK